MLKIIKTGDGSHTIFVPELAEHYHSVHGAVQESEIVFIRNGYDFCRADPLRIFEAGFGTGLNAFLTAYRCTCDRRPVVYTSAEKYPLPSEITASLNYPQYTGSQGHELLKSIHQVPWEEETIITDFFRLKKVCCDLTKQFPDDEYDLVYFDAFGPDKQPEMWSEEIFLSIYDHLAEHGVLVTYSVKGSVKRILRRCGFKLDLLPGPPGKREVMRALKNL